MPWVKQDDCIGCGICVDKCPVGVISLTDGKAEINDDGCIRCGICHDVCPQSAIRHDVERIPLDVQKNLEWVKDLMRYYKTSEERKAFLDRIVRHFKKEAVIAQKTLERVELLLAEEGA